MFARVRKTFEIIEVRHEDYYIYHSNDFDTDFIFRKDELELIPDDKLEEYKKQLAEEKQVHDDMYNRISLAQ